ncbi:hypothetical protein JKF63_03431 [Porcisia hertigi]|uniref:RNA binding protein n=1 Tax=Porcisia hertigi TaxID=2761500 RepID=A0A836HW92_9TRYP|nr:hypothetical protein JKF63_03431 [Porcisia hertigi]
MPSRAVIRKKQRRDAKRKKTEEESRILPQDLASVPLGIDESLLRLSSSKVDLPLNSMSTEPPVSRKRALAPLSADPSSSRSSADGVSASFAHPVKRQRLETLPPERMPDGLSRKERRRWETSQRLERQMSRLVSNLTASKEAMEGAAAQHFGSASGANDCDVVALSEMKPRHDPKYKQGTFWRDRKEKRARTLFLGGIPASFSVQEVKNLVCALVNTDSGARDYVDEIDKDAELVEEVDMLPVKHNSKVKHMYVTMASVSLAGCAAAVLDRYKLKGRELRCNFAADKSQREEAIRRRNTAQS